MSLSNGLVYTGRSRSEELYFLFKSSESAFEEIRNESVPRQLRHAVSDVQVPSFNFIFLTVESDWCTKYVVEKIKWFYE